MTVRWNFPTRVLFGEGTLADIAPEAKRLEATRALIVTDPGVVAAGIARKVQAALAEGGVATEVFESIASNPSDQHALAASEAYVEYGGNIVIGVGGGSALDVAKIVRLCATHPAPLAQYDDAKGGSALITQPLAPMIAVPTTAGTGSEVGRSAVVTMTETNKKTVFFAPNLIPDVAILDPALTTSMPPKVTACTGFDALTHCVEALCTKMDHPMCDAIAMEGIRLVHENLERAVEDGSDLSARGAMLKASMMGAVAFQKGLGACHSLAHPLSARADLHHGLANALCLPAVVNFNRSAAQAKLATIGGLLGMRQQDEETMAFECSGAISSLRQAIGLPEGLGQAGIQEDTLETLADLAFEDVCHTENPRPCTRDDLLSLYKASF
ncbi:MAG: iron-containing alcohol dehydrogenase [Myxococcales bacterium]|nr:iron-containing alcohol dehydrogenase [Myxococcales bacterium]MDD9971889.1 iron-containing alcohol dehydrogenase [Myxococcales bacterium]